MVYYFGLAYLTAIDNTAILEFGLSVPIRRQYHGTSYRSVELEDKGINVLLPLSVRWVCYVFPSPQH